jgi:hypothetical protein
MSSIRRFIEGRLGLKINDAKSKVDRPRNPKFLGFSFFRHNGNRIRIAPKSIDRFKNGMRGVTARSKGRSVENASASRAPTSAAGCSASGSRKRRASTATSIDGFSVV